MVFRWAFGMKILLMGGNLHPMSFPWQGVPVGRLDNAIQLVRREQLFYEMSRQVAQFYTVGRVYCIAGLLLVTLQA